LWHGANWTFVVWGALHAAYYLASRLTQRPRAQTVRLLRLDAAPRTHALLQLTLTFLLVNLGWVFFRADSLPDAWYIVTHLASGWDTVLVSEPIRQVCRILVMAPSKLLLGAGGILLLEACECLLSGDDINGLAQRGPVWMRWAAYVLLALAIMNVGVTHEIPFVYFQF
ncbi:MAG: hypothetical protein JXR94_09945, partial [Candidatus Hydrogenedentes bacterium]|nr:hypothetical protein [Candidatus Hydrogenedentota bacterium]